MSNAKVFDEVLEGVRVESNLEVPASLLLCCLGVLTGNNEIIYYLFLLLQKLNKKRLYFTLVVSALGSLVPLLMHFFLPK
jgi:hypothetical protein